MNPRGYSVYLACAGLVPAPPRPKKTDVVELLEAFNHVGLLVNGAC